MCIRDQKSTLVICAVLIWIINGSHANVRQDIAEETQHAVCNISTKDVQTSANASVTRQLKGVCTSKQMELRFRELESKMTREFRSIKKMLSRLHVENFLDTDELDPEYSENTHHSIDDIEETKPIFSSFKTTSINYIKPKDEEPVFTPNKQRENTDGLNFPDGKTGQNITNTFTDLNRIVLLNDTIQREEGNNVYYYFWKVENFNKLMKKTDVYVTSHSFMVLGHDLVIQIFPNQPQENYISIKLRASSSFVKKHKFSILRRTTTGESVNSLLLGMDHRGSEKFPVTLRTIKNSECLKEDSIIIELNIFL